MIVALTSRVTGFYEQSFFHTFLDKSIDVHLYHDAFDKIRKLLETIPLH